MNLESSPSVGLTPRLPETQRASEPIGRLLSFKNSFSRLLREAKTNIAELFKTDSQPKTSTRTSFARTALRFGEAALLVGTTGVTTVGTARAQETQDPTHTVTIDRAGLPSQNAVDALGIKVAGFNAKPLGGGDDIQEGLSFADLGLNELGQPISETPEVAITDAPQQGEEPVSGPEETGTAQTAPETAELPADIAQGDGTTPPAELAAEPDSSLVAGESAENQETDLVAKVNTSLSDATLLPISEGELNKSSVETQILPKNAAIENTLAELTQEGYVLTNSFENPETIRRQFTPDEIKNYDGIDVRGTDEFQAHVKSLIDLIKLDPKSYQMFKDNFKSLELVDGPSPNWLDKQRGPSIGINDKYGEGAGMVGYDLYVDRYFKYNQAAKIVSAARRTQLVEEGNPYGRVKIDLRQFDSIRPQYEQTYLEAAKAARDFVMNPAVGVPKVIQDFYQERYVFYGGK